MKAPRRLLKTVDEYIAASPLDVQPILEELRQAIREEAPNAKEEIRYGIPTFRLNGNLVHFAAFRAHIGFYPTPAGIDRFRKELSRYEMAKGTVRFPLGEPLPLALIRRIVAFRVKQDSQSAAAARGQTTR